MFSSLRWKITATYFSLFVLTILLLSGLLSKVLENYFLTAITTGLTKETALIQHFITAEFPAGPAGDPTLNTLIKDLGAATGSRITIIDNAGNVLSDSGEDTGLMNNHLQRPEFDMALQGERGVATRYSATMNENLTYVALPLEQNGLILGAVRLSIPLTQINQTLKAINTILFYAFIVATIIFVVLSLRFATLITKPLENLTRSAKRIALGDLNHRAYPFNKGEIGELQQAINFMAEKQQEKIAEINDKKSKLEAILEHMTSGIVVFDRQRVINLVNHATEKLLNVQAHNLTGKTCQTILRDQQILTDLDRVLNQGKILVREIHLEHPVERFLQAFLAPVFHHDEIKEGMMVLTDVTTIRLLEKMRSQFVANVSHELKTPLTSIKGFVETLQSGAPDDRQTAEKFLDIIATETDRLTRLIEDILELSKIEASKNNVALEPVSLKMAITGSVQQLLEKTLQAGLTLDVDVPVDFQVLATNDWLKQVLLNLLQNAISYTPSGGRIEVTVKDQPQQVLVSIKDTGIGIPANDLPRIFERFYRVDKDRSRAKGGTGLGLSIVKHLAESFGGSVWAQSQEGKGSTFYFTLKKA